MTEYIRSAFLLTNFDKTRINAKLTFSDAKQMEVIATQHSLHVDLIARGVRALTTERSSGTNQLLSLSKNPPTQNHNRSLRNRK